MLAVLVLEDVLLVEQIAGAAADFDHGGRRRLGGPMDRRDVLDRAEIVYRRTHGDLGGVAFAEDLPFGGSTDAPIEGLEAFGHREDQPHMAYFAQCEELLKMADTDQVMGVRGQFTHQFPVERTVWGFRAV